jgi:hypothetical protein
MAAAALRTRAKGWATLSSSLGAPRVDRGASGHRDWGWSLCLIWTTTRCDAIPEHEPDAAFHKFVGEEHLTRSDQFLDLKELPKKSR